MNDFLWRRMQQVFCLQLHIAMLFASTHDTSISCRKCPNLGRFGGEVLLWNLFYRISWLTLILEWPPVSSGFALFNMNSQVYVKALIMRHDTRQWLCWSLNRNSHSSKKFSHHFFWIGIFRSNVSGVAKISISRCFWKQIDNVVISPLE